MHDSEMTPGSLFRFKPNVLPVMTSSHGSFTDDTTLLVLIQHVADYDHHFTVLAANRIITLSCIDVHHWRLHSAGRRSRAPL